MKAIVKIVQVNKGVKSIPMSDTEAKLRAELLRKSAQLKSLEERCKDLTSEIEKRDDTINRLVVDIENQDEMICKLNTKITHQLGQIYAYKSVINGTTGSVK